MNTKPKTKKVKSGAAAVARALGILLFTQDGKRKAQIDGIREKILAAKDFPPKVRGMHDRAAVIAWGASRLKLIKKDGKVRFFEVMPKVEIGDLPEQKKPVDGNLFGEMTPEEIEQANRQRLQKNLMIHLGKIPAFQPLRQFEVAELVANKLIPKTAMEDNVSGEDITGGFRGVANYINNNFSGVIISHTSIHNWCRGMTLSDGCRENFPSPSASGSNRWKKDEVDAWVLKYLKPSGVQPGLPGAPRVDDISRQQKADADIAEMKADQLRKETSGLYTLTEIHERTLTSAGIEARNAAREAIEKKLPKRFSSGLELIISDASVLGKIMEKLREDCVVVFADWQRQTMAAIDSMIVQSRPSEKSEET